MDVTTLTDEALAELLNAVLAEQERRADLVNLPGQIAALNARHARAVGKGRPPVAPGKP